MDRFKDKKFAEFFKAFLSKIAPKYSYFEKERLKYINIELFFKKIILFITPLIFLSTIFTYFRLYDEPELRIRVMLLVIPGITIFCFFTFCREVDKKYKNFLKREVMPLLLEIFGDISWRQGKKNETKTLTNKDSLEYNYSNLFVNFNSYMLDDEFSGRYKDVDFKASEVSLINGDENHRLKVFQGVVLTYKFNKPIKSQTIVALKKAYLKKDGLKKIGLFFLIAVLANMLLLAYLLSDSIEKFIKYPVLLLNIVFIAVFVSVLLSAKKFLSVFKNNMNMEPVILEDPKFNKRFKVYSHNQIEARYLVTPAFMEKFYNLKTVFGADNIRCSFFGNNLIIAIETKRDLFEFGNLFEPVRGAKTIEKVYDEINAIYEIIDYFKLNENA